MGLFDAITKVVNTANQIKDFVDDNKDLKENLSQKLDQVTGNASKPVQTANQSDKLVMATTFHQVSSEAYGDDDREYKITFMLNDSFKEADSHAGEVEMLNTYAPDSDEGEEGALPYFAVQMDDSVYSAVDEFKKTGSIKNALEVTPLNGKFYFKAKINYFGNVMYFYGLDRCGGFWENNGLCMVYEKSMMGTEDEKKLMKVLDEIADTYCEE